MIFSDTLSATKSRLVHAAAILLCTACTIVSTGAQAAPTILVMGDSLSAEYGLQRGQGWVALMEKRLKDKQLDYSVVNASISGETTSGGNARLAAALTQNKPAVVVIELGSNDGLRGLSLAATRTNLQAMITASEKAGAKVALVGMQLPPNFGRDYTTQFKNLFPELSKQYKTTIAPFMLEGIGEKQELFQADGLHPLAQAHPRILDNIWPAIEPLLKSGRSVAPTKR